MGSRSSDKASSAGLLQNWNLITLRILILAKVAGCDYCSEACNEGSHLLLVFYVFLLCMIDTVLLNSIGCIIYKTYAPRTQASPVWLPF